MLQQPARWLVEGIKQFSFFSGPFPVGRSCGGKGWLGMGRWGKESSKFFAVVSLFGVPGEKKSCVTKANHTDHHFPRRAPKVIRREEMGKDRKVAATAKKN